MGMQQRHQDVAAYALGVLEPGDAFRFEEHLAECVLCTVQLSDFSSVASAISDLDGTRCDRVPALAPAAGAAHRGGRAHAEAEQ